MDELSALRRALQLPSRCAMGIVPFRMARAIGRGYDGFGSECQRGRWRSKRRQLLQTAVLQRLHAMGGYQHVRIFCLAWGTRNFQTYFNAGTAKAGKNGYWMALGGNNDQNIIYALKLDEAENATISSEDVRRGVSVRCVLNHE